MKFINFSIVKIAACLTTGIVLGDKISFPISLLHLLPIPIILLLIIWVWERKKLQQGVLYGIVGYFVFVLIGMTNIQSRQPSAISNHYSKTSHILRARPLQLKIKQVLKSDTYHDKYIVELLQMEDIYTEGRLLLSITKDQSSSHFCIDDLVVVSSEIVEIQAALNPNQFDYKVYLQRLGVYHQVRCTKNEILSISEGKTTIRGFAERIRNHLIEKLSESPIEPEQLAIVHALVLGQRRNIDKVRYAEYAAAGAVHILAVSGLHVGVLFAIISWLLSPLKLIRYGKLLRSICIVIILWGFALIAGLSPSVVRAVTMFSFFALAAMLERPTNTFNTLFLSFLLLLLIQPNWLFHVGFQLSYLAVFFILWVQPILYKWYQPKNRVKRFFWGILTVTVAAQMGVAPLSLFYFHQFPGLFFVTNLVILPFLSLLLCTGIIVVLLATLDLLPNWLAVLYNEMITHLNGFVHWVAEQNTFLFKDISFSGFQLIATYIVIIQFLRLCKKVSGKTIMQLLISFVLILSIGVWYKQEQQQEALMLFHINRRTLLAHQKKGTLNLYQDDTTHYYRQYPIKSYRISEDLDVGVIASLPYTFQYKNNSVLRLDSLGVFPSEKIDIVMLTNSPKIHLERLIDSVNPKEIVADGSNYKSYVRRWKTTCEQRNIVFHYTGEQGMYRFK